MSKQVRETAAGKVISAWVILRADGTHVATVHAHYGAAVTVDVWNEHGVGNPTADERAVAGDHGPLQGRASGYGYDRLTAALTHLPIDGVVLVDHGTPGLEGEPDVIARHSPSGDRYYIAAGLERLTKRGYRVIQAI